MKDLVADLNKTGNPFAIEQAADWQSATQQTDCLRYGGVRIHGSGDPGAEPKGAGMAEILQVNEERRA